MPDHNIVPRHEWDTARDELLVLEKEAHPAQRRAGPTPPGPAVGSRREGVHVPDRRRAPQPGRTVRRAFAAGHLQLHVRARLRSRLPGLLVHRRQLQRGH